MKKAGIIFGLDLFRAFYTGYNNVREENKKELEQQSTIQLNQRTVSWQGYVGVGLLIIGGAFILLNQKKSDI